MAAMRVGGNEDVCLRVRVPVTPAAWVLVRVRNPGYAWLDEATSRNGRHGTG
jgi:hypothetical protein